MRNPAEEFIANVPQTAPDDVATRRETAAQLKQFHDEHEKNRRAVRRGTRGP